MAGVLDSIQPTVPTQSFRDGLAALTPPAPFLAPLGHEISPVAPSGLVGGLTAPVAPTVQRRAAGDLTWVTPPAPGPARPATRWPSATTEIPPVEPTGSVPVPVVTPDVVVPTERGPVLTSAPPVTTIQRSLRSLDLAPVPPAAPGSPPLPPSAAPLPLQRATTTAVPAAGPVMPTMPVVEGPPAASLPSLPEGPVLQLHPLLGAEESATLVMPGTVTPPAPPLAPTPAPLPAVHRQNAAPGLADQPRALSRTAQSQAAQPSGPPLNTAPPLSSDQHRAMVVQRRAGLGAPLAEPPLARFPAPAQTDPVAAEVAAPSSLPPVAPLLGSPTGEEATTEPATEPTAASRSEGPPDLPLVVAQRLPSGSLSGSLTGPGNLPVAGPEHERALPSAALQRSVEAPAPLPRPAGASFTEPAAPRQGSGPGPGPGLVSHPATPLPPPAQRLVAQRAPERSLPSFVETPSATAPPAVEASAPDVMVPSMPAELPAPPSLPGGLPGAAGVVSAVASGAGALLPAGDLDALAGRLYDKIRYRLKAELRLDRERAGLITDRR